MKKYLTTLLIIGTFTISISTCHANWMVLPAVPQYNNNFNQQVEQFNQALIQIDQQNMMREQLRIQQEMLKIYQQQTRYRG